MLKRRLLTSTVRRLLLFNTFQISTMKDFIIIHLITNNKTKDFCFPSTLWHRPIIAAAGLKMETRQAEEDMVNRSDLQRAQAHWKREMNDESRFVSFFCLIIFYSVFIFLVIQRNKKWRVWSAWLVKVNLQRGPASRLFDELERLFIASSANLKRSLATTCLLLKVAHKRDDIFHLLIWHLKWNCYMERRRKK